MAQIPPRIVVREYVQSDYSTDRREYHVTATISSLPIWGSKRLLRDDAFQLNELGDRGIAIVREVLSIEGIAEIHIQPYQLTVMKGGAFEWEEVEAGIIEALKKCFGGSGEEVKISFEQLLVEDDDKYFR